MNAAEALVDGLQQHGVEWIATLCGHGLDPLLHAAKRAGLRLVDVRNEQTAGYMADACGRLTRRPGVCAVSSGVAHINALTGVANAWFDQAPMLLISGAGALSTAGCGHFQEMDQVALAAPFTRYARIIDSADTRGDLEEALCALNDGPYIDFPWMFRCEAVCGECEAVAEVVKGGRGCRSGGEVSKCAPLIIAVPASTTAARATS